MVRFTPKGYIPSLTMLWLNFDIMCCWINHFAYDSCWQMKNVL